MLMGCFSVCVSKQGGVIYIDGCLLWDIKGRVRLYVRALSKEMCPCVRCIGEMIRIEPLVQ